MRIDKKKLLTLFVLTLLIVSLVFVNMKVGRALMPEIYVDPPQIVVTPSTNFSVDINIDYIENLYSFEFKLGFDPTVLTVTNAVDGSFLNDPKIFTYNINNTAGYVHIGGSSFGAALPKTGGSPPPLATVYFHCEGPGNSTLHLYDTFLWDPDGFEIPHTTADGEVDQVGPPRAFIKVSMPDFGQHSSGWCWVGAAANSFYWLKHFGGKPDLYPSAWDWGPPGNMTNPVDPDSTDNSKDGIDNDQDGKTDEDHYDGIDNDRDGMIDEDGNAWYDDMDDWSPGPDGIDNDNDTLTDEDLADGLDNDGDGKIDEEAAGYTPGWQPNPGYHPLLKKIAGTTFRDINQNGTKDPGEKNYIYSQPVFKWDYVLGLYYFIKKIGANLIVHDKIDPIQLNPTYELYPVGPPVPPWPHPVAGPGGRICKNDTTSRGINQTNAQILRELGILVEFSNITLEQYKKAIWCSNDVLLWLRRLDKTVPYDHLITGVGYNQTTVPFPTIIYSDPWNHAAKPPHDDNCALPPWMPDHNKDPRHEPWPYNLGNVISKDPLIFEDPETGATWRVINMIRIYQPLMYWKENYTDYAPSGVPDFDQRQDNWNVSSPPYPQPWWTWCAPTAVANSLWWMDSRFENSTTPPPTINDTFQLLTNYTAGIDDHHPNNTVPFIQHLAWLMDTDGQRTGIAHAGTWTWDMETGIAQYLSWSGVNPLGDVDGNGIVDQTDWNIVNASLGSQVVGGMPVGPWKMAADIYPETVTGPYTADNNVTQNDLDLVEDHMNETGQFYERTIDRPDFYEVEDEVERCEDVVLVLGFWYYDPETQQWSRADPSETPYAELGLGHAVTVAGINSTKLKIAISDPGLDAFEAGLTPGRSPVNHTHAPPEPPYSTHNNASLVSNDIYDVTFIVGCPGGTWALQGYVGNPQAGAPPVPGYYAVVEAAVITSPLGVHDVAVTDVTPHKTIVSQGYNVRINATVENQGNFTETFNVTAYANTTAIQTLNVTNLPPGNSTTITFAWNTTGFTKGNYTISANATIVPAETDTTDNTKVDGTVRVNMPGDVNEPFGKVNIKDIGLVAIVFGSKKGDPNYNPNADLDCNGKINIKDIGIIAIHFGETDP